MEHKKMILRMLMLAMLAFVGCSSENPAKQSENTVQNSSGLTLQSPSPEATLLPEKDPVKQQIKQMSLKEKIGQMVIVGLEGYAIDDNTKKMIEDYHVGGFILFGSNVKSSDQLLALVNSLKSTNSKSEIPLFICVDEEGGRVSRMPGDLKKLPTNKRIGDVNSGDFSYEVGGILAEEIRMFGFNLNFAPVLDINSNPQNPVIGDRAFSSDAKIVSKLGVQTMKGIQDGGVIPVIKHFPGHGDTSEDSHVGLPLVTSDLDRLKAIELVPFQKAIQEGADAVMIAHILLNKVDPQNPASLSKIIITDLLREQLDFNGVVITDDMTMGAIEKNYTISDAAIQSVKAGSDIVLVCHENSNEVAVLEALRKAVESGSLSEGRVDESVYRILKLKEKYKLTDRSINSISVEDINNKLSGILDGYIKP